MEDIIFSVEKTTASVHCGRNLRLFKQYDTEEFFEIEEDMPDIERLISLIITPEVLSLRAINTIKGISAEGHKLTGKKVAAEIKLKQKVLYTAKGEDHTVHVLERESYFILYVVVPKEIKGADPEALINGKHLRANIRIEDIDIKKVGCRTIYSNLFLLVELYRIPTYELCYSLQYGSDHSHSNIFVSYQDGSRSMPLTTDKKGRNIKPVWSPTGQEIAFASDSEGAWALYVYNLRNCSKRRITNPETFRSLGNLSWAPDSKSIIFSASAGDSRELFVVALQDLQWKQISQSKFINKNYSPKYSHDGDKIAFLKSTQGISSLFVMRADGTDCRKITEYGSVKDYEWFLDSRSIAYILSKEGKSDELCVIQGRQCKEKVIAKCNVILNKQKIKISPDQSMISFIGSGPLTEDIFVYDLKEDTLRNITENLCNVQISDYVWDIDSTRMYFSSNELSYYNIYSVLLEDCSRIQLTSTTAAGIQLDYRPRIR